MHLQHFYNHVEEYYINADWIIAHCFLQMTPEEVSVAFDCIIQILSEKAWYYFQREKKGFDALYLDSILIECSKYIHFLECAWVVDENKVIKQSLFSNQLLFSNQIRLSSYWSSKGIATYYYLYALAIDYNVIKFLAGILSRFPNKSVLWNVQHRLSKIEQYTNKLSGFKVFAAKYEEALKRLKGVFRVWKKRVEDAYADQKENKISSEGNLNANSAV